MRKMLIHLLYKYIVSFNFLITVSNCRNTEKGKVMGKKTDKEREKRAVVSDEKVDQTDTNYKQSHGNALMKGERVQTSQITTISSMSCSLRCCSWPDYKGKNSSTRWRDPVSLQPAYKYSHTHIKKRFQTL